MSTYSGTVVKLGITKAVAIIGLLVVGCGESRERSGDLGKVVVLDSAGVRVIQTPGTVLEERLDWEVGATPVVELDGSGDASSPGFFRVGGVAELPDGGLLVVDGSSRQLLFFTADGQFLQAVGRAGAGPGEFRGLPRLVPAPSYDSLVVFDPSQQRFSVFSPSGELRRTNRPLALIPTRFQVPWGEVSLSRVSGAVGLLENRVVTLHSVGLHSSQAGLDPEQPAQFRLVDPTGGLDQVIELFKTILWFTTRADELGQTATFQVPFSVAPAGAIGREGFYIIPGGWPRIRVYNASEELSRVLALGGAARTITSADLDAYVDVQVRNAPNPAAAAMREREHRRVPLPEVFPTFDTLVVDTQEWVWARTYEFKESPSRKWLLFDPEGRGRGTVDVPAGLRIHQIGEDFILGVRRDEWGVEYVRRFALTRR